MTKYHISRVRNACTSSLAEDSIEVFTWERGRLKRIPIANFDSDQVCDGLYICWISAVFMYVLGEYFPWYAGGAFLYPCVLRKDKFLEGPDAREPRMAQDVFA